MCFGSSVSPASRGLPQSALRSGPRVGEQLNPDILGFQNVVVGMPREGFVGAINRVMKALDDMKCAANQRFDEIENVGEDPKVLELCSGTPFTRDAKGTVVVNCGGRVLRISKSAILADEGSFLRVLLGGSCDAGLPRDSAGHVFLDVDSAAMEHLVRGLEEYRASGVRVALSLRESPGAFALAVDMGVTQAFQLQPDPFPAKPVAPRVEYQLDLSTEDATLRAPCRAAETALQGMGELMRATVSAWCQGQHDMKARSMLLPFLERHMPHRVPGSGLEQGSRVQLFIGVHTCVDAWPDLFSGLPPPLGALKAGTVEMECKDEETANRVITALRFNRLARSHPLLVPHCVWPVETTPSPTSSGGVDFCLQEGNRIGLPSCDLFSLSGEQVRLLYCWLGDSGGLIWEGNTK